MGCLILFQKHPLVATATAVAAARHSPPPQPRSLCGFIVVVVVVRPRRHLHRHRHRRHHRLPPRFWLHVQRALVLARWVVRSRNLRDVSTRLISSSRSTMTSSLSSRGNPKLIFKSPRMIGLHPCGHASHALRRSSTPLLQSGGI